MIELTVRSVPRRIGRSVQTDERRAERRCKVQRTGVGADDELCVLQHERQLAEMKELFEAERIRQEIDLARQIQQKLFPPAHLPLGALEISGASYPAEATGGDYFDYIPLRDGSLGIVIGDVSGHGFGPALVMAQTRAYLLAVIVPTHPVPSSMMGKHPPCVE